MAEDTYNWFTTPQRSKFRHRHRSPRPPSAVANKKFASECIAPARSMSDFASPLFNEKTFSDVVVVCADKTFYCHKIILARSSVVFMAMLTDQFKEARENKIEIPNFEPDVAELVLKFVYSDNVDEKLITWDLFEAAKMYDLARLQQICLKTLRRRLDVNSCCRTLEATHLHDLPELFDVAIKFFQENKAKVAKTEDWKRVAENPKLMEKIILHEPPKTWHDEYLGVDCW